MPEKAKGKGKDVGTSEETGVASDAGGGDNLLSRIGKSAASLPSALFSKENMAGAVSGLGNGEKGEGSRTAAAAAAARATESLERVGESSAQLHSASHGAEAIRSAQTQEHIAMQEASFAAFLNTTEPLTAPEGSVGLEGGWHMRSSDPSSTVPTMNDQWTHSLPASTVAEQEARDGMEVVALLSGDLDLDAELAGPEEDTISPEDMASLRKALFGNDLDSSTSPIAWDHALNFIPPSLLGFDGVPTAPDTRDLMGTEDMGEGWEAWINQWSRVLTGYHDEVWGDLGALVEEAKKEVKQLEEVKPGERPPEPTALLRLRAILGHLRGA